MRNIISVSSDPALLKTRKLLLERTGHHVTGVLNYTQLKEALARSSCDLVIIGYTIPPPEKRRIFASVKDHSSQCPVVEIYQVSPELPEADAKVCNHDGPESLLATVEATLSAAS